MLVIPVIDLRNAQAVRAVAGRRDQYQPLATQLSASSEPRDVVRAYRGLFDFTTFYLADLDAIEHTGNNRPVVERLLQAFPDAVFWLDAGFCSLDDVQQWPRNPGLRLVLGSESQTDFSVFRSLLQHCRDEGHQPLLSLDFKDEQFLGPPELLHTPEIWPQEVILMKLDRVGVSRGPDQALPKVAGRHFFAAGGVRDKNDLQQLTTAGYAGVLVASALHDGHLSGADLAAFG
jgi:phosphoribosylformimino-5-aminoimidazole carboxamide ribotide isomerase